MLTRFESIRVLAVLLTGLAGLPFSTQSDSAQSGPPLSGTPLSLRQAADRVGMLIGTAVRPSLLSESAYAATLSREFNMVEPEDALKWWVIRQNRDSFDFQPADDIVRFAQAHGMKVRGHCLVWDHDHPDWLAQGHFTPPQLSQLLHEHIDRVMKHYAGQVFAWDVVNEAMDERGKLRDSIWYNQPGIGFADQGTTYLEQVFRWAHDADPHALLFYNEAEGEMLNRKSDAIYEMLKDFKHRGVPIDGVGLQLHLPGPELDSAALAANIARLTALAFGLMNPTPTYIGVLAEALVAALNPQLGAASGRAWRRRSSMKPFAGLESA